MNGQSGGRGRSQITASTSASMITSASTSTGMSSNSASTHHHGSKNKSKPKSLSESAKHILRTMLSPRSKDHPHETSAKGNGAHDTHHASASSAASAIKRRRQHSKHHPGQYLHLHHEQQHTPTVIKTRILIDATSNHATNQSLPTAPQFLSLPSSRRRSRSSDEVRMPIDAFLVQQHADLVNASSKRLALSPGRDFEQSETDRVIYANQRELVHATHHQTEWIVTHKATTCHMLAMRSYLPRATSTQPHSVESMSVTGTGTSCSLPSTAATLASTATTPKPISASASTSTSPTASASSSIKSIDDDVQLESPTVSPYPPPLSTLSHVDSPKYKDCVVGIVDHHLRYYRRELQTNNLPMVHMELHVVGGFDDPKQKSRPLSAWLLNLLAALADRHRNAITFSLVNCLISSSNTECSSKGPLVRGLAINTHNGTVLRVRKVAELLMGPQHTMRQARLWAAPSARKNPIARHGQDPTQVLAVTHDEMNHASTQRSSETATTSVLKFIPFWYCLDSDLDWLLDVESDEQLIQHTSTSPYHEENVTEFCRGVRRTLMWMGMTRPVEIFGPRLSQPLYFQRVANSNRWRLVVRESAVADK